MAAGATRVGPIAVDATDPEIHFVVEVGESVVVRAGDAPPDALRLNGPAVELVEALCFRMRLPCPVPADQQWLLSGLAEVFDREP